MKVVIMRGIPGAGKSTYVEKTYPGAVVCSADHFFTKDGRYEFDRTKLGEAHSWCLREFVSNLVNGTPLVVVDNTNISVVDVAPYAALAGAYEYEVQIVTIRADWVEAHRVNVHGVPVATCRRGAERLEVEQRHFSPRWQHEIIDSWRTK